MRTILMLFMHQMLVRGFRLASRMIGPRRALRACVLAVIYSVVLALSFAGAYELRWDFFVPRDFAQQCWTLLPAIVLCKLLLLFSFGQFRSVLSYFGLHDFSCVVASTASASLIMLGLWYVSTVLAAPPRGVILMDFLLCTGGLTSVRLSLRVIRTRMGTGDSAIAGFRRRIGIVGAGDVGSAFANDLISRKSFGMMPVMFLDDDPRKWGRRLHGVPIFGPISRMTELAAESNISEVIITMPSAGPKKIKEVIDLAKSNGLQTSIVPSFTQLAAGKVRVDRFRPVELEDLLGRKPVDLDSAGVDDLVRDRVVMVTGAGGSIGSELCRQILARAPRLLLLVEQSEVQLFQVEQELIELGHGAIVRALVADVLDVPRMHEIFGEHRPQTVFHAAAHKHVVMMERQPAEAVKNNFLGTARMAAHAREHGVETFVLVSTDKAINPTSVMGATKRLAEYAIMAEQKRAGNRTAFLAVRFGNVLGSSGSVIPIFKRQIAAGGPVTVTHPEVTRYFMTIPEAVGLVLQAATMGQGGEVFVLDMGTPLRIVDVARQLVELSGFRPDVDIEIKFIGLRPGEKLFEELRHTREDLAATDHARVLRLIGDSPSTADVESCLGELLGSLYSVESDDIKRLIQKWVPEYTPYLAPRTDRETAAAAPLPVVARVPVETRPEILPGVTLFPEGRPVAEAARSLFRN